MGFSMKFDTVNSGLFIVYIEGSLVITSKIYCNSNFEDGVIVILQTLVKCRIMQHFNSVCTVCQSTYLWVYTLQSIRNTRF